MAECIPASELACVADVQLNSEAILNILLHVADTDDDVGICADADVNSAAVLRSRQLLMVADKKRANDPKSPPETTSASYSPEFMLAAIAVITHADEVVDRLSIQSVFLCCPFCVSTSLCRRPFFYSAFM